MLVQISDRTLRRERAGVLAAGIAGLILAAAPRPGAATEEVGGAMLYAQHCAACHGAERLGGIGPALLPENLERLRRDEAEGDLTGSCRDADARFRGPVERGPG